MLSGFLVLGIHDSLHVPHVLEFVRASVGEDSRGGVRHDIDFGLLDQSLPILRWKGDRSTERFQEILPSLETRDDLDLGRGAGEGLEDPHPVEEDELGSEAEDLGGQTDRSAVHLRCTEIRTAGRGPIHEVREADPEAFCTPIMG